jgi:hypothetical protein
MNALAEQCLCTLVTDTENMLDTAFSQGVTLQQVLGLDADAGQNGTSPATPSGNVVQVVFQRVLQDETSPKRLTDLVIRTLAEFLNPSMWEKVVPMINHRTSLLLIKAMLIHRQAIIEEAEKEEELHTKSEDAPTGNEQALITYNYNE